MSFGVGRGTNIGVELLLREHIILYPKPPFAELHTALRRGGGFTLRRKPLQWIIFDNCPSQIATARRDILVGASVVHDLDATGG